MKILLTKTLPSSVGTYYRVGRSRDMRTLELMEFDGAHVSDGTEYWLPGELGGYWAKVDQSMFEVEDE